MKKKISLFIALLMAITFVMGIRVTTLAEDVYELTISGDIEGNVYLYFPDVVITGQDNVPYIQFITSTPKASYKGNNFSGSFTWLLSSFDPYPSQGDIFYYDLGQSKYVKSSIASVTIKSDPVPQDISVPGHVHNFQWQTITEPTKDTDGLEGEVCSCGATRNTQPISAYGFAINDYATKLVNASKSGQVIKLELGEWNSFPKAFMEKVAAKSAQNVTFVLKYKWNHVKQEITISAGTTVDTSLDWYGPAKMQELYGAN